MYTGKKLLILGATASMVDMVDIAKEMGLFVIVAATPVSPEIFQRADLVYDISTSEKERLLEICRENGVDGIYTGMSDLNPYIARWLCDRLGLPYYATQQQLDECNDKAAFKRMCTSCGVSVPRDWSVTEFSTDGELDAVQLPVIVKPARNCGTKGITVCRQRAQLRPAMKIARDCSNNGEIVVEEFVVGDEFAAYYTLRDGEITLSSMCDRYSCINGRDRGLCHAYVYPSVYLQRYLNEMDQCVKRMFIDSGYKNGIVSLQGFVNEKAFYVFEVGFRSGGTLQYLYTERLNGISNVKMLVDYAITGSIPDTLEKDDARFTQHCCTLTVEGKPGVLAELNGLEEIRATEGVVRAFQMAGAGDVLPDDMSMRRILFWIYIMRPTTELLRETVRKVQSLISVYNENGEDMLAEPFDPDRIPTLN